MCAAQCMRVTGGVPQFPHLEGRHPCFSLTAEGHDKAGRLHLPVSPACNISCRFCKRDFNGSELRPGVSRLVLRPEQTVEVVRRALALCPSITVVGIAGPGDTLATDHAIKAFELIHAAFPNLINCLSTNGLLLPEKAEQIVAAGVETVTVTVNAVDAVLQSRIISRIAYRGRALKGEEAAAVLIANQLDGIAKVVALGATVKVNTVLVPGINDGHIETVAKAVSAAGASVINVIPLIPQHEFADLPPPSDSAVGQAREAAARYLSVFSHCQRCRADACGIPGVSEFAGVLYDMPELAFGATTFSHG